MLAAESYANAALFQTGTGGGIGGATDQSAANNDWPFKVLVKLTPAPAPIF